MIELQLFEKGKIIETGTLEEMRHLTQNKGNCGWPLETTFRRILILVRVYIILEIDENTTSFQVDTEHIDTVIKHISKFDIVKLESAAPTLEDLFMRHYEGSNGYRGGQNG